MDAVLSIHRGAVYSGRVTRTKPAIQTGSAVHSRAAIHSPAAVHNSADGLTVVKSGAIHSCVAINTAGGPTVVVQPGVTLYSLRRALRANNLTLGSWPALMGQTVGGAVGTGSQVRVERRLE